MKPDAARQIAPTRAERIALRVMQGGAVAAALAVVTFEPFELDRFSVPKELVLHLTALVAGLFALGALRRTPATRVDALLAAFLAVSAVSAAFATNHWLAARALAVSVSGVAVFWAASGLRAAGLARPLLAGLALFVVVACAAALTQAYGLETPLFTDERAPGGTLGNRNSVAHLAALGLPVLLVVAFQARRTPAFVLRALGVALVVEALVLTRSRAAWLGVAVVAVVLVAGSLAAPSLRRAWRRLWRVGLLLCFAGAGVAAAVLVPNALRWRSDDPYLETARGVVNYREGSGRGRLIQYQTTLRMALHHPLVGVGPGNWPVEYPAFAGPRDPSRSTREAGTTTNPWPSSDWVALVAERGLAAAILFALAWGLLAVGAWRRLRTAGDPDEGLAALVLLATLCAVAVVGAFDAVTLLAWPTLFFWAAAGALWAPETARPLARLGPRAKAVALLVLVLAAGAGAVRSAGQVAAMGLYTADRSLASLERAARLDPGNYRVHLRLAQRYGRDRARRCAHAVAAHGLFPHAASAERLARRCD